MPGDDAGSRTDGGDDLTVDPEGAQPARTGYRIGAGAVAARRTDRYQLGDELGRGGIGKVTSARDRTLQRPVAIKDLHEHTEQGRRRFVREGLITARLQHPAIVPVFDAGSWETGDPYLVMKQLEGKTLAEVLATRPSLDARLALLPNMLAIADALAYAHAHDVVHRDVKPGNIMLGAHGETVLLDWGASYDLIEDRDAAVAPAGTPRYMAPEHARGEPPEPAFDVYSLGVTLATVLGGGADTALPAAIPLDLAAIVDKATAGRAQRYPHAGLLADDLRRFIAGQLVSARRYTRSALAWRWIRRHRIVVLALGAIAAISAIAVHSVVRERNRAIAEHIQATEREHALILLQARTSLRTDPTATVAWLERYPAEAPHQEELLALLDEAEGRGVARHVWHGASPAADVGFAGDRSLVSVHGDGEIAREDLETGARSSLASVHAPLSFVRAVGDAVVAIDQRGILHRWRDGVLAPAQSIDAPARITGLFRAGGDAVKVTFVDRPATVVGGPQPDLGAFVLADDEADTSAVITVSESGELAIIDPTRRVLWKFSPDTWVRASRSATAYLAVEALPDGASTLWVGRSTGEPPIELAHLPPCVSGDDRLLSSDVADDGRLAVLQRCGVVHAYDVDARRELAIANPDRVGVFEVARDSRWLALGRTNGIELIDLATGGSRTLLTGGATARAGISADRRWLFTSGPEQGIRAWRLDDAPAVTGRLASTSSPTALFVPRTGDQLAIRQHLACSIWSTRDHRVIASTTVPAAAARDLDDEPLLWAWDGADDGRTCIFAGTGGAVIAAIGRPRGAVVDDHGVEACVLAGDGSTATCRLGDGFVATFDAVTGQRTSVPRAAGVVRGLVRYRDRALVLVARDRRCLLETFSGAVVATLPGNDDCRTARSSNAHQPGAESGIVIDRAGAADVWTDAGTITVPAETGLIEASAGGLVAVARDRELEVWDVRTRAHAASPPVHARAIQAIAWSPDGVLASADDERVQLWDPAANRARAIYAPRTIALAWSRDGRSLFTTDGVVVQQWPIAMSRGASLEEVRVRLRTVTTARIAGGRAETPDAR